MIILGIDPGYGRLGYAVLKKTDNKENLIDCGCLETSSKEKYSERIIKIAGGIEKIIKKHRPEILAIEKIYFTTNQKTALKISEIRGIIIYLALKNKMQVAEYTPLEVKAAVCGYGKASKEQIKKMVDLLIKVKNPPKNDDTYDAIALCLTCFASLACRQAGLFTKKSFSDKHE